MQKIFAPNGRSSDFFGHALAQNGNWLAVGAWGDDEAGPDAGAVHIYTQQNDRWQPVVKLTPPVGGEGSAAGNAVAIEEDYVVAGAWMDFEAGENAGAVHVFDLSTIPTANEHVKFLEDKIITSVIILLLSSQIGTAQKIEKWIEEIKLQIMWIISY